MFPQGGFGVPAGVIWAWTLAAAMLLSAVLTPLAAAWADRRHAQQRALVVATTVGTGGLVLLAATPPALQAVALAAVIVGCVGFDLAQVFTSSLLPRIADDRSADRLSAQGFAAGYAGGAIALVAATAVVGAHSGLGLTAAGGLRASFLLTAAWWSVFSLPAVFARFGDAAGERHAATSGRELLDFARGLVRTEPAADGRLGKALLGSTLVLGAVQTAIGQFSSVALERFDLDGPALVRLILLVQAVALPGALAVGWLSGRFGRRLATLVCLTGWVAVVTLSWFVATPAQLHALAVLLALVLGGIQSVLRATIAALAPAGHAAASFGVMQVGTKLAGFVASLAFGGAQLLAHEPRAGLLVLLAQLLAGGWFFVERPSRR